MIRPIDIRLNATHPELPLSEAFTFTGSPSTVLVRGVPPNCGRWAITSVNVAATFPDNSTTTRAAVQSANGVWVATLPATATSGRTTSGLRIMADGIDENGEIVTGYILGVADFAVASLGISPAPEPGETSYQMLYFDTIPSVLRKGDVTKIDGVLKFYDGTAWLPFANIDPSNYVPTSRTINSKALTDNVSLSGSDIPTTAVPDSPTLSDSISTLTNTTQTLSDSIQTLNDTKASKSDATLTPVYSQTPTFSEWTISPAGKFTEMLWLNEYGEYEWYFSFDGYPLSTGNNDHNATSVSAFDRNDGLTYTATRTRTDIIGYRLGPDEQTNPNRNKPLASEAEAEALRTGLALIAPDWMQTSAYSAYDCVKYNGVYYYAKADIAANTAWNANNWGSLANLAAVVKKFLPLTGGEVSGDLIVDGQVDISSFFSISKSLGSGLVFSGRINNVERKALLPLYKVFNSSGFAIAFLQNLAPDYDATSTYELNNLRVHGVGLYRCTTAITTAEAWTPAHWTEATVEDILAALRAAVMGKLGSTSAAPAWVSGTSYAANALVTYDGVVYRCKADTVSPHTATPDADATHWEAKPVSELFLPLSGGRMDGTLDIFEASGQSEDRTAKLTVTRYTGNSTTKAEITEGAIITRFINHMSPSSAEIVTTYTYPSSSGTLALTAGTGHNGNLAALDANGNPTDSLIPAANVAVKSNIPYDLVTKTIANGEVTLDDHASNAVTISATLSPNTLTVNFPTATTTGKVRDFALRLNIASGVTAPELVLPQGVTLENDGGEVPEIADGGTGGSSTILYFSETATNKFLVKGETLTAIAQA